MEGWAKIIQAADFAGLSVKNFRTLLQKGLKHSRLPSGTIQLNMDGLMNILNLLLKAAIRWSELWVKLKTG